MEIQIQNTMIFFQKHFPLQSDPTVISRIVETDKNIRDYLSWRQADTHVNNLYNTTFWNLVLQGGMSEQEATQRLKKTNSGEKNEILFSQFNINYNNEPAMFRKGCNFSFNSEK